MFYDEFAHLCSVKGVSRTRACIDCGVSRTAWHKWENGTVPNGSTINKLAVYFGVSVGQLLGHVENKKSPSPEGAELTPDQIKAIEKIKNMPPEELARKMAALEAVLNM